MKLCNISYRECWSTNRYQRPSKLHDRWRIASENDWERSLICRLGWPSLRPSKRTSQTCQSYRIYDFEASRSNLLSITNHVRCGSNDCSLYHFIRVCLAKVKSSPEKPVIYVLDETSHVIRNASDDRAIISIYSDPGWQPQSSVFHN